MSGPAPKKTNVCMSLSNLLAAKRSTIIKKWISRIIETYPDDTRRFFKREKDRFANPVGSTIAREIETLYDGLLKGDDTEKISSSLDSIIRIRAVQDFTPSQSIAFVFQLKKLIREAVGTEATSNGLLAEVQALEDKIDDTALMAFDIYSKCRQKIYDIKVNEVKRQVSRLLQRANLVSEIPNLKPDLSDDNMDRLT